MSDTARSRSEKQGGHRRLISKTYKENVFPELLIEKESVRYTFINMKPVWFDLEQLLYLKRKNYGEGLSRVDLFPLTAVALVRAW